MHTYIIAEIGQNHNGDVELAKKLIDVAAMPIFEHFTGVKFPGVDAVKFTKRDLAEEMTDEAGRLPYDSVHSFGKTYLEHRRALELSIEQHVELEQYARAKGLDFIETLCSPGCLKLLDHVRVDAIKIASRDVTHVPLLEVLGELDHRIIISTGMCSMDELRRALQILSRRPKEIAILHCVSRYPALYEDMNLRSIPYLMKQFPEHQIGLSDHSLGIALPVAAVTLGASIIEKHITLNREMKGSDHAGSVGPDGLWRIVRDVRGVETALGTETKEFNPVVRRTQEKLGRSLAVRTVLATGETLEEEHLCMLSPGTGLTWDDRCAVVGKRAVRNIPARSLIHKVDFECETETETETLPPSAKPLEWSSRTSMVS